MIYKDDQEFPAVSEALIRALEGLFPVYVPKLDAPERVIWYELGKRAVVAMLRDYHDKQRGGSSD